MIVMRHGESEFNVVYGRTGTDPGIRDPKLTARGRDQVVAAGEALAAQAIAVRRLIASPYTRALETASILAETLAVPITVEPLVRERYAWTCDIGTPTSHLAGAWPGVGFPAMAERWWPTDEEHDHQVRIRAGDFHRGMVEDPDHGQTLVVSHWWFIRALTGAELANAAMVCVRLAPAVEVVSHPHP